MSGSAEEELQNPSQEGKMMRAKIQSDVPVEKGLNGRGLAKILRQMITLSAQKFNKTCRAQMTENGGAVLPVTALPHKKGKKLKNRVVGEQDVFFSLPENCNLASIRDIDKVLAKLGGWKIQSRQRNTLMCDTYYRHCSSQKTLRSITEVVNFILPECYTKEASRKRSRKCQEVITPRRKRQKLSPEADNKITEADNNSTEEILDERNLVFQKANSKKHDYGPEKNADTSKFEEYSSDEARDYGEEKTIKEMLHESYNNLIDVESGANKNDEKEMLVNTITETKVTITEVKEDEGKMEKCTPQEEGSLEVKDSSLPEESGIKDTKVNPDVENNSEEAKKISLLEMQTSMEEMLLESYNCLLNLYYEEKRNNEKEMQVNTIAETMGVTLTEAKDDDEAKLKKCLQEAGSSEVKGISMSEESGTKDGTENFEGENNSKEPKQSLLEEQIDNEDLLLVPYNELPNLFSEGNMIKDEKEMQVNTIAEAVEVPLTEVTEDDAKMKECLQGAGSSKGKGICLSVESGTIEGKENLESENISKVTEVTEDDAKMKECLQGAGSSKGKGICLSEESGTIEGKENLELENISKESTESLMELQIGIEEMLLELEPYHNIFNLHYEPNMTYYEQETVENEVAFADVKEHDAEMKKCLQEAKRLEMKGISLSEGSSTIDGRENLESETNSNESNQSPLEEQIRIEEMLLELEPHNNMFNLYYEENLTNNEEEMQVNTITTVEKCALLQEAGCSEVKGSSLPEESAGTRDNKKYLEVGSTSMEAKQSSLLEVQTNDEQEHEILGEAFKRMKMIDVGSIHLGEKVKDPTPDYPELKDIPTDWSVHDRLIDTYFDECDLVN